MTVPRNVQEILDHADALAARFESYEPSASAERNPAAFIALRDTVVLRSDAERAVRGAVDAARAQGYSWALIGGVLGTSGEAARQRYGTRSHA